ncbi:MAG: glycosyltransferase [Candidatus Binatia bacterium]
MATTGHDHQAYPAFESVAGVPVRWIDRREELTWAQLGLEVPETFVFTSWNHPAYMSLAADARRQRGTQTVSMMDNIFHGSPRQWAGALWFRAVLRRQIDILWVPGRRGLAYARFLGMPESRVVQGLYGADGDIFSLPERAEEQSERVGALFVGQLIERKGVGAIVEAAERDVNFRAQMRLIGNGPLAERVVRAGLRHAEFRHGEDLAGAYRAASVFMLPSTLDHWGVALHEAALSGCLLGATRQCGAVADLIVHGRNGYVMESSSPSEVLSAFRWAEALQPRVREEGRQMSRELAGRFGPRAFSSAFEGILAAAR